CFVLTGERQATAQPLFLGFGPAAPPDGATRGGYALAKTGRTRARADDDHHHHNHQHHHQQHHHHHHRNDDDDNTDNNNDDDGDDDDSNKVSRAPESRKKCKNRHE
ncbi:unnamed protein product, partial [Polarella glacialis]